MTLPDGIIIQEKGKILPFDFLFREDFCAKKMKNKNLLVQSITTFTSIMIFSCREPYYPGPITTFPQMTLINDCGEQLKQACSISVEESTMSLQLSSGQTRQIVAMVLNDQGTTINPAIVTYFHYSSDNESVCIVGLTGVITPIGPGSATVTVCHGGLTTQVRVNVSL